MLKSCADEPKHHDSPCSRIWSVPTKNFGDDILDQGISCRYFKYYTYQFNMYLQYLPTKGSDKPYRFGDASVSALGTWFLCFSYYCFCFV